MNSAINMKIGIKPLHIWGIDILGLFPLSSRQVKYLVVAIEYFTKLIEVEPLVSISTQKIQTFLWKNVIFKFGVPKLLISDNGTQFANKLMGQMWKEISIRQIFSSMEHSKKMDKPRRQIGYSSED